MLSYVSEDVYTNNSYSGNIQEACSDDPAVDKLWKDAMKGGLHHGYNKFQTSGKGLQAVHDYLGETQESLEVIGCVAFTMLFKFGDSLCNAHYLTQFAVSSSADWKHIAITEQEARDIASDSARLRSANFDYNHECNNSH